MYLIKTVKSWPQSPAQYVVGGVRYTSPDGAWVEVCESASIGECARIGECASIGEYARIGKSASIGKYASIGEYARIGESASIGECARIGKYASIGEYARIGESARIGECASIGEYARIVGKHDITPLYIMPAGGRWPVYVCDVERRLVGIGCEVHEINWWLDGGADEIRAKHGCPETKDSYDAALRYVAESMKWNSDAACRS